MGRVCGVALLVVAGIGLQPPSLAARAEQTRTGVLLVRSLAGRWKAPEYKVAAGSALDVEVWGEGASHVRNVELALEPSGDGILRVHTSVVDRRGRTRPFSASVIEAKLELTASDKPEQDAGEPRVKVVSAEERYLDGSRERNAIEGLQVRLSLSIDSDHINLRFDKARGLGSFGETLQRQPRSVR